MQNLLSVGLLSVVMVVVSLLGGCGKHLYNRTDLEMDLTRYHMNLRWERLGVAMSHVHPELHAAFTEEWRRRSEVIQLQSLEVMGTSLVDEDTALVQVKVDYVDVRSMKLHTMMLEEKWIRSESGWVLMSIPEIPPLDE